MTFAYPWVFALIAPLAWFFWTYRKADRDPVLKISLQVPHSLMAHSPQNLSPLFKFIALSLLIAGLARPQKISSSQPRKAEGIDIVMVLDVSLSMLIQDMGDRSRGEIARSVFDSFIKNRQNDRIGLVVFSGEPLTLAPPTLDYGLLLQQIQHAVPGMGLKDGTAIGDGLSLAVHRLKSSQAKSKVVILLTDGDNNVGRIDPVTAGDLAQGYGIKVYSIAIGTEGRVLQPLPQVNAFGQKVYTQVWVENRLNPQLLKEISQKTNGKFWRVADEKTLREVFETIDSLEKAPIDERTPIRYDEQFQKFLLWGLLMVLAERAFTVFYLRRWQA